MKYLVTGFAGFIGSNLVRRLLERAPDAEIIGLDAYTYAARPDWAFNSPHAKRLKAVKGDISDSAALNLFIENADFDAVIHLAAESHVCRSIEGPDKFIRANVNGTFNLLEACRKKWDGKPNVFHHVSTDEVFGSLSPNDPPFDEDTQIKPNSPYAASKASSDHIVNSYARTYGMNTRITNCSNNFGPNQHEEKLVPGTILKLLKGEEITVYGDGLQVRDWIWVDDHIDAIFSVMANGGQGERYCVGGEVEISNLQMIDFIHSAVESETNKIVELKLKHTNDRPTDDRRYAIENSKVGQLGWSPWSARFDERLRETVSWYMARLP